MGPATRCGKERDEAEVVRVPPTRLDLASVDVDRVAHRLEREERDPEGEHESQVRQRGGDAQGIERRDDALRREVEVFEELKSTPR